LSHIIDTLRALCLPIKTLLSANYAMVKKAAAKAMGCIGNLRAVSPLISSLGWICDCVQCVSKSFIRTLVNRLLTALKTNNLHIHLQAAEILGKVGNTRIVDMITALLDDES